MMRLGIVDLFVTRLDFPLSPRRDDRHIGCKAFDGQFKPNLIVSLAGCAVCDGVCSLSQCDLSQLLADHGPRERGAEQIFFIFCVHHDGRDDDLITHFVREISDNQLACAGLDGLFLQAAQFRTLADVRRYGFLIEQLVRRNFNTKYRQSILGVLWSFLNPLLTMLVQYLVFSTLFRSAIDHFPVYLISGIIVFSFFTECVTLGMDAIVMNASLITKVAIPKLIFPFSRALSSLINFLISLLPLLLLMLLTGVRVSPALLLLPLMIALLFLFALGVTLVMATLNVFFRDTRFLWSVISLLWTYATPIFYPDTIWPEGLRGIFHLNPMYQLIDFLRQIVIAGIPPTPERLLACAAGAFGMLMIGLLIFRRYEKKFVFHL